MSGDANTDAPRAALGAGLAFLWKETPVQLVAFVVFWALLGLIPPGVTLAIGAAVDAVTEGRSPVPAVVALAAFYGVGQMADSLSFGLSESWGLAVLGRYRERAMQAIARPPLLDHTFDTGVMADIRTIARQDWPNMFPFATAIGYATRSLIGGVGSAVLVASWSPAVAVLATGAWLAIGQWNRRNLAQLFVDSGDRTRRALYWRQLAMDRRSAGELRIFGLAGWMIDRYRTEWRTVMDALWSERRGRRGGLAAFIGIAAAVNVSSIGALALAVPDLDPSTIAVVASALLALPLLASGEFFDEALAAGASRVPALQSIERMAEREEARVVPARPAATDVSRFPMTEICFDDVSFSYPSSGSERPVLNGVDLTLQAGGSLAIVGANGAGKTTLVKLLARLHDPGSGRITVDGIDLRDLDPRAWQRRVAEIFQDFERYELTARQNVSFGAVDAEPTEGRLDEAARAAGADELIASLPNGWDTILSRRYTGGVELSAGQWQRIALARAVYAVRAGAGVLVLDEPTANLDVQGEAELFDRFLDVTRGATTVLISHRFSTVRRADRIAVLEHGKVTEIGSHDQLIAAGGLYSHLFAIQADRYIREGTAQ